MSPPTSHVVICKKLTDKGLHTFRGMLGYCMQDNGEGHFEFVHHMSAEDMNDRKMEYVKFGKVGLSNYMSLSYSNILQRAHKWARFRMKNHLGTTLPETLCHMYRVVNFSQIGRKWSLWGLLAWMWGMRLPFGRSWWILMIFRLEIYKVFLDKVTNVSRMHYCNSHNGAWA